MANLIKFEGVTYATVKMPRKLKKKAKRGHKLQALMTKCAMAYGKNHITKEPLTADETIEALKALVMIGLMSVVDVMPFNDDITKLKIHEHLMEYSVFRAPKPKPVEVKENDDGSYSFKYSVFTYGDAGG